MSPRRTLLAAAILLVLACGVFGNITDRTVVTVTK